MSSIRTAPGYITFLSQLMSMGPVRGWFMQVTTLHSQPIHILSPMYTGSGGKERGKPCHQNGLSHLQKWKRWHPCGGPPLRAWSGPWIGRGNNKFLTLVREQLEDLDCHSSKCICCTTFVVHSWLPMQTPGSNSVSSKGVMWKLLNVFCQTH